ncbi:hypothetical protein DPMN_077689 [Dreissena polymorpha]|uniref:Uncharacterized protein n=1 Tax=Dreissena polymorpha TaxID=45954 RepID=A0A9D4BPK5_DREPO|nr:hypothetical protein DPMN_077689 [Dreissena polymorpha]
MPNTGTLPYAVQVACRGKYVVRQQARECDKECDKEVAGTRVKRGNDFTFYTVHVPN